MRRAKKVEDPREVECEVVTKGTTECEKNRKETPKWKSGSIGVYSLYFLPVQYGNKIMLAMLDSGAQVNVIGRELADRLECPIEADRKIKLRGCGILRAKGCVKLKLKLPTSEVTEIVAVIAEEFGTALILGAPFLHGTKARIDYDKGVLSTKFGVTSLIERNDLWGSNGKEEVMAFPLTTQDMEARNEVVGKAELTDGEKEKLKEMLTEFKDLWADNPRGETSVIRHKVVLKVDKPVRQRPRRFTEEQRKVIDEEIEKMLKGKVIQASVSPHAQEVVLVKKKTGDWRFCVDYRDLNKATITDEFPFPRIQDLIRSVRDSKYFVTLDLRAGYWQILMEEKARPLTAFRTHRGLFEFNVMPYGLKNAPATFSRLMGEVLGDLYWKNVCCYLDDILVHGKTFEECMDRLQDVLRRLRRANLTLALNKCAFFPKEVLYLGYVIAEGKIKPNQKRVEALGKIATPKSVKDVRSLLGCVGYFRQFIKNYAEIAEPLNRLLRKKVVFEWSEEQENARGKLMEALSEVTLSNSLTGEMLRLETDASEKAVGAVLLCRSTEKEAWKPVEFSSKNLSETERRWPVHEKEAFAIVHALDKFDPYLRGRKFEVWTDNASLTWMATTKAGKVARWAARMAEYEMSVIYRPGRMNVCADFLSRYVENERDEYLPERATVWNVTVEREALSWEALVEAQKREPPPNGPAYQFRDGVWFHWNRLWVPPAKRLQIIEEIHTKSKYHHPGVRRTVMMIRKLFSWSGIMVDAMRYIKGCLECQRIRPGIEKLQGMMTAHKLEGPFEKVYMDIYEWSSGGNKQICLTMLDNSTKWAEATWLKTKEAKTVAAEFVKTWVCRYGCPKEIVTDNDPSFCGRFMEQLYEVLGVQHLPTTVSHPDANAPVESFHRVLSQGLQRYTLGKQKELGGDELLQLILYGYRMTIHTTLKDTPAYITFGIDPRPGAAWRIIRAYKEHQERIDILNATREEIIHRVTIEQLNMMEKMNKGRRVEELKVGELVLLPANRMEAAAQAIQKHGKKIQPKYSMPYRVVQVFNKGRSARCRCLLPLSGRSETIKEAHVTDLRRLLPPQTEEQRKHWDEMIEEYLETSIISEELRRELIAVFWEEIEFPQMETVVLKRKRGLEGEQ